MQLFSIHHLSSSKGFNVLKLLLRSLLFSGMIVLVLTSCRKDSDEPDPQGEAYDPTPFEQIGRAHV